MLDVDSAVPFLLDRGLIRDEELLAGEVAVEAMPRRNRNLRITIGESSGLFVKQPEDLAQGSRETLRAEGDFYRRHAARGAAPAGSLPALLLYEPSGPLLVLELLPAHRTLGEHARSLPPPHFPIATYRALGRRLAGLHAGLRPTGSAPLPPGSLPWVAGAHEPSPSALRVLSPASLAALEILQGSAAIREGLGRVGALWTPRTTIHGDLRADNVLVRAGDGAHGGGDLRLVDWELSQPGDPAWDLAAVLSSLVVLWLGDLPDAAALPWAVLQSAGLALWQGYRAHEHDERAAEMAARVATFAAARLVQSALELAARRAELPDLAVLLLQVSENVFADPDRAAAELFALA